MVQYYTSTSFSNLCWSVEKHEYNCSKMQPKALSNTPEITRSTRDFYNMFSPILTFRTCEHFYIQISKVLFSLYTDVFDVCKSCFCPFSLLVYPSWCISAQWFSFHCTCLKIRVCPFCHLLWGIGASSGLHENKRKPTTCVKEWSHGPEEMSILIWGRGWR